MQHQWCGDTKLRTGGITCLQPFEDNACAGEDWCYIGLHRGGKLYLILVILRYVRIFLLQPQISLGAIQTYQYLNSFSWWWVANLTSFLRSSLVNTVLIMIKMKKVVLKQFSLTGSAPLQYKQMRGYELGRAVRVTIQRRNHTLVIASLVKKCKPSLLVVLFNQ